MAQLAKFTGSWDIRKIEKRMDAKERKVLFRTAAYARKVMKTGMRKRKKAGPEGGYPASKVGTLKRLVRFDVNLKTGESAVGPIKFKTPDWQNSTAETVPELLQEGGTVTVLAGNPPKTFVRNYPARPFVTLTTDSAAPALARNMQTIPF